MRLAWTMLRPSLRERRWRLCAQVLSAASAIVLVFAAIGDTPLRWLVAAIAFATLFWLLRQPSQAQWQIAVADDGTVLGRESDGSDQRLQCVFESTWLITFRAGGAVVAVWPDSLSATEFRRLWVFLRWRLPRNPSTAPDLVGHQ